MGNLAGLEVDAGSFRERFTPSVAIGLVSFIGPSVVGSLLAFGLLDWTLKASLIALSKPSSASSGSSASYLRTVEQPFARACN